MARAYQVPRSLLLGQGTRSVTTYEYDEETGLLVRSVTVHDSPWQEDDIGWAAAQEAEVADQCPTCSQPLSESTAMADGEPLHEYEVEDPARCHSCDELIKQQEAHGQKGKVVRPGALIWTSQRRDRNSGGLLLH